MRCSEENNRPSECELPRPKNPVIPNRAINWISQRTCLEWKVRFWRYGASFFRYVAQSAQVPQTVEFIGGNALRTNPSMARIGTVAIAASRNFESQSTSQLPQASVLHFVSSGIFDFQCPKATSRQELEIAVEHIGRMSETRHTSRSSYEPNRFFHRHELLGLNAIPEWAEESMKRFRLVARNTGCHQ
jgi:hypothetical protein